MTTQVLRFGRYNTIAATGEVYGYGDEPNIVGRVDRNGRHYDWSITAAGRELKAGTAWTESGAWAKATAAAHRPGIGKEAAR